MENKKKKCSFKEHKDIYAIYYCQECKIFMCNKCINHHQGLFENHNLNNLDKEINEIFFDICKEKNHTIKLQYFCKIIINYVVLLALVNWKVKEMSSIKIAKFAL